MEHIHISHCIVCGGEGEENLRIQDHMVSQETFTLQECGSCGFVWTSPRPNQSAIGRYYDSPAYLSHDSEQKSFFAFVYRLLRWYAAKRKVKTVEAATMSAGQKGSAWLDVGCGVGVFLNEAKSQGHAPYGVELSDKARAQAEQRLQSKVFTSVEEVSGAFDAITLWHVLEHLPEPKETLVRLHTLAKPGAALVVAVPNRETLDAKIYGAQWAAWDVPIHFWHFSKKDMTALMKQSGWKVTAIQPMLLDAYYVSLLSEQYATGSKNWLKAIQNGWKSNRAGKRGPNTSSLIYLATKEAI